jgi:hypothetical protein
VLLAGCATHEQPPAQPGLTGTVLSCTEESQLRSQVSVQAVPMTFVNQSGGEIHLIWLGYDGRRVSYGTVPAGLAKPLITFVTHPWVIEDSAGRCIKIVQPGQSTRAAIIQVADISLSAAVPEPAPDPVAEAGTTGGLISGVWKFAGVIRDGDRVLSEIRPVCLLRQDGNAISGSCKGPTNEGSVTGTIEGKRVDIGWHIVAAQVPPVRFRGVLERDGSIDGEMNFPGYRTAPFAATRQ